ncbi:MAG: hypothetical protein Q8P97_00175 [bacterium]|nr:hypothetical protein [bacterium]
MMARKHTHQPRIIDRKFASPIHPGIRRPIPPPGSPHGEEPLRLVPLGGLEEVGRNMSFFEYKDEIVIVDMGIQFPEEDTPGIDWIIPNISYLEPKKKISAR